MKITLVDLKQKCEDFRKLEGRASFFEMARKITKEHPLEASILFLATWNAGRFRWFMSETQNLFDLEEAVKRSKQLFERINHLDIRTANFDEIGNIIKRIYEKFSCIKGVKYTGTSKVMHLFSPNLLVMWDSYIRSYYGFKADPAAYLNFQKRMQREFGHITWNEPHITLAKAIDEYNYMKITFPKLKRVESSNELAPRLNIKSRAPQDFFLVTNDC